MYLAASLLVSTSFVQKIVFAVTRSATCFKSSLIAFIFEVWAVWVEVQGSPVFARVIFWNSLALAIHLNTRAKVWGKGNEKKSILMYYILIHKKHLKMGAFVFTFRKSYQSQLSIFGALLHYKHHIKQNLSVIH